MHFTSIIDLNPDGPHCRWAGVMWDWEIIPGPIDRSYLPVSLSVLIIGFQNHAWFYLVWELSPRLHTKTPETKPVLFYFQCVILLLLLHSYLFVLSRL